MSHLDPRYIEIPNEEQFDLKLGYVLEMAAGQRELTPTELAVKARVGAGYVARIYKGIAPFMQVFHVRRMAEAMDLELADVLSAARRVSLADVRAWRRQEGRIVWAGGKLATQNVVTPAPRRGPSLPKKGGK